jgi:hypothetical protein
MMVVVFIILVPIVAVLMMLVEIWIEMAKYINKTLKRILYRQDKYGQPRKQKA